MDPHHHHPCHLIHLSTATSAACCHGCYSTPHTPPPPHLYSPNLSHPHHQPHQYPAQVQQVNFQNYPYNHQTHTQPPIEPQDQAVISSLLRRITALESSIGRHVPAARHSLRDAAARTIQTHFRAFLVCRSRTLRQLKTLASVKSSLNALKMLVSDGARVDSRVLSRKAMDLILKIDSIEGGDSMIRDGKRSISRDLDQFLGSIGLSVKKNRLSRPGLKNSKVRVLYNGRQIDIGRNVRGTKERMRAHVESANEFYHDDEAGIIELENFRILNNGKIGSLPKRNSGLAKKHNANQVKAKKNVSFSEDGDLSRVFVSTHEPYSSGDEEGELVENLRRRVEKFELISKENGDDDQEAYSEDEESTQNGEENLKKGLRAEGNYEGDDVDFVFSAPTPVKMETRKP